MKSPVYGQYRGRTKRKRTIHASAGNVNMRGKRTKRMGCLCCECMDLRPRMLRQIAQNELRNPTIED
jgi:G3E family GTPase